MNTWTVLWIKEFRENWRSFKLLWIPLLFLFLGVSEPLTNYYLADILQAVGNMPEGFQMMLPELQPHDILFATTEQFQLIGLIVIIAVFIGTISRERSNGTATLIYVRPVSATSIYVSKWAMGSFVAICSAALGYCGSIYYTSILYGSVSVTAALTIIGTYALWLLLVLALTVTMSALCSTAVAATVTIILIPIGGMIDSMLGGYWNLSPWKLARYGVLITDGAIERTDYWGTVGLAAGLIILLIGIGVWATGRNRHLTTV